jgi:hypothetical protein
VRGLRLCVLGASESTLELWRGQGLRSMYLGDEALVHTRAYVDQETVAFVHEIGSTMPGAGGSTGPCAVAVEEFTPGGVS